MKSVLILMLLLCSVNGWGQQGYANEVISKTDTEVVVRIHPSTGIPYVSIISLSEPPRADLLSLKTENYARPDYQMLRGDVRSGEISYDGPVSSRKKVYLLAGTLAVTGVAAGVAGPVLFSATGAVSAAGGGAGFGSAGAGLAGAATAGALISTRKEIPEDYVRTQESELLEYETDFYKLHILGE